MFDPNQVDLKVIGNQSSVIGAPQLPKIFSLFHRKPETRAAILISGSETKIRTIFSRNSLISKNFLKI